MTILRFDEKVLHLDEQISAGVLQLVDSYRWFFQCLKWPVDTTLTGVDQCLQSIHPILFLLLVCLGVWRVTGVGFSLFTAGSLIFIGMLGFWSEMISTLSMVFSAVFFCVLTGVSVGICCGVNTRIESSLRPFLDGMQTTPAFVYLVPIVMLFSIGNAAGVFATIIFAFPPIVKMTSLGIQQVPSEFVEVARAFGATRLQVLMKVQLPLALPSIMAGMNQTIMLALSMVVIAAFIGADGLGAPVIRGLNSLDIGLAATGGISIVLLAIILDRFTRAIAKKFTKENLNEH